MRVFVIAAVITIAGCGDSPGLPPSSIRKIAERVTGVHRMTLVADDGAECRSDDYGLGGHDSVWMAKVGERFQCNWHERQPPERSAK